MIDEERIKETERNVRQYLSEGLLKIKDDEHKKFVLFFMEQAEICAL